MLISRIYSCNNIRNNDVYSVTDSEVACIMSGVSKVMPTWPTRQKLRYIVGGVRHSVSVTMTFVYATIATFVCMALVFGSCQEPMLLHIGFSSSRIAFKCYRYIVYKVPSAECNDSSRVVTDCISEYCVIYTLVKTTFLWCIQYTSWSQSAKNWVYSQNIRLYSMRHKQSTSVAAKCLWSVVFNKQHYH